MPDESNVAQDRKAGANTPLQANTETAGRLIDFVVPGTEPTTDVQQEGDSFTVNGVAHGGPGAGPFRDGLTLQLPHERAALVHGTPPLPTPVGRVNSAGDQGPEPLPAARLQDESSK